MVTLIRIRPWRAICTMAFNLDQKNRKIGLLETDAITIPVFYNVEPSVRRLIRAYNGLYAQALENHEQKLQRHC